MLRRQKKNKKYKRIVDEYYMNIGKYSFLDKFYLFCGGY